MIRRTALIALLGFGLFLPAAVSAISVGGQSTYVDPISQPGNPAGAAVCPSGYAMASFSEYRDGIFAAPGTAASAACISAPFIGQTANVGGQSIYYDPHVENPAPLTATCPAGYVMTSFSEYRDGVFAAPGTAASATCAKTSLTGRTAQVGGQSTYVDPISQPGNNPTGAASCPAGYAITSLSEYREGIFAAPGTAAAATCAQLGPSSQQTPPTQQQSTVLCPDGSEAPNSDASQCPAEHPSCPSGTSLGQDNQCHTSACSSVFGSIFSFFGGCSPTGASCPSSWSIGAGGMCYAPSCPAGEILQGGSCVATKTSCPVGFTLESGSCTFTGCPEYYSNQNGACVLTSCPANYKLQGSTCVYTGAGAQGDGGIPAPSIASWKVTPLLVKSGTSVKVSWSAENVSSCAATDKAGDSWSGASGSKTSSPILQQTKFDLTCKGLDGSTIASSSVVNIVPVFHEE